MDCFQVPDCVQGLEIILEGIAPWLTLRGYVEEKMGFFLRTRPKKGFLALGKTGKRLRFVESDGTEISGLVSVPSEIVRTDLSGQDDRLSQRA